MHSAATVEMAFSYLLGVPRASETSTAMALLVRLVGLSVSVCSRSRDYLKTKPFGAIFTVDH